MKKFLLATSALLLLFSCQKEEDEKNILAEASNDITQKRECATMEMLQKQLTADPGLAARMQKDEEFTRKIIETGRTVNGRIQIPVVFNIIYNASSENISESQIRSQIDVLNNSFNGRNPRFASVPGFFAGVKATVGIDFVLDLIVRKKTNYISWSVDNLMKGSSTGGLNATDPTRRLNIWVCRLNNGVLGYAQFPRGNAATDGVVLDYRALGTHGAVVAPYNEGATGVHEVGHWMNLRHIWGDAGCGDDFVADTPKHGGPNYGTPGYPKYSSCGAGIIEMPMNFMDYTDDKARSMFSNGQKARMNACFMAGGSRASFR